jgi:hypothetical protein
MRLEQLLHTNQTEDDAMISKLSSKALALCVCLVALAPILAAQTSTQLYSPLDVRGSLTSAGYGPPIDTLAPDVFETLTLELTCPAQNVSAVLSGPLSEGKSGGNLLVDNNILVTVTPLGGTPNPAVNVCAGGVASGTAYGLYNQNCFSSIYEDEAGDVLGVDPDTLVSDGGVPPIEIGSLLIPGAKQMVKIDAVDEGVYLAASTIFLDSNCTENGVTGPTHLNGNPIPQNDPTAPQLTQGFEFDRNAGSLVSFTYDLSRAANDPNGSLTIPSGSTPGVNNQALPPATFRAQYRPYTSFAPSRCLVHFGEVDAQGNPACKLYTMECVVGSDPAAAGANCPVSSLPNERVIDTFDGPEFFLGRVHTPHDGEFSEGFGFLMASETWTGGTCTFDPAATLNEPCPKNLMVSFTGPGNTVGRGTTTHPNSAFITVSGVPEARTSVSIKRSHRSDDEGDDDRKDDDDGVVWVNSTTVPVKFHSVPPYLYDLRGKLAGADTYIAQPIRDITFGVSVASQVPDPADDPISTDTTLFNGDCPVPTPSNPGSPSSRQPAFDPPAVNLSFPGDGLYALHYYAQDCAGTKELKFKKIKGSWTTSFRTRTIGVDTTAPAISIAGHGSAGTHYALGSQGSLSYSCTDNAPGSGVVHCGPQRSGDAFDTASGSMKLDTSTRGTHHITIWAVDRAGNKSSADFTYTVQ